MSKVKSKTESSAYHVELIGFTWGGFEASYEYTFDHEPTEQEIKQRAGDFESISDYEVTRITRSGTWEDSRITRKVVRPYSK